MGILLGFAPFIAFGAIERTVGPAEGLLAGALIAGALLIRDLMGRRRAPKVLDIGTTTLFGALAVYAPISHAKWSLLGVRLSVDIGLLLIVLVSMAIRRPFTLQYAREQVSPEHWHSQSFIRTNYVITAAWAVAFLALIAADLLMIYVPEVPQHVGIWMTVIALVGAIKFTGFYPAYVRRMAAGKAIA
jgi:hypothetical protein